MWWAICIKHSWADGVWSHPFPAMPKRVRSDTPSVNIPRGLILYTADGHMSAQLTPGPGAEFVSYGGRFRVDESSATVRHWS